MSDALGKILGNPNRVKIMRLFLLNPENTLSVKEVAVRSRSNEEAVKKELKLLQNISFIKQKSITVEVPQKTQKTKKHKSKKAQKQETPKILKPKFKKVPGYFLNQGFPYNEIFRVLLSQDNTLRKDAILKTFKPSGKLKLLIVSGVFIQQPESRADLLIVGDNLNRRMIEDRIKIIESELGRELVYAVFETPEFMYRFNMYDKLIRDILELPHEKLVDLIKLEM